MSGPRRSKRKSSAKKPFVEDCPTVSAPDTFEEQSCKVSGVAASSKAPRRSTRKSRSKIAVKPKENSITIQHGLNEELYDMFLENVDDNLEEDDDLIPASGASVEAAHIGSFPPAAANILSPASYTCEICHSVLKTKHGFSKHVIAHRIKVSSKKPLIYFLHFTESNSKRPSAAAIEPLMESIIVTSLNEIASEHGAEKKKYVKDILNVSKTESSEWSDFVSSISQPILESVCKPTKMLPANQYKEQLISLNKLLNNEEKFSSILIKFMALSSNSCNQNLAKMILDRLLSKLVDKTVDFVFSEMRKPCLEEGNNLTQTYSISDNQEEIAFNLHMRKLLQKYYIKGLRYGTKLWLARCASIRQRFVQGLEFDSSPSVDSLISNDTWEEDKNGIVQLKLDPTIVKFFLFVESTIERLIIDDQSVNSDTVLQVLFRDAPEMLDLWHSLTSHFLSELESLTFMKDIISLICNLSLRLEVGRERDAASRERIQKYALRTDLKTN